MSRYGSEKETRYAVRVRVRRRHNGNPDNGPGRTWSEDPHAAIADLLDRVWTESRVALDVKGIE